MDQGAAGDRRVTVTPSRRLHGRDAEIEAIERFLDDARTGRGSRVLALIDDPGLGSTALLEHAAAIASADMRVLRCVGSPAETGLAFAGLLQMLRPVLGLIGRLPAPQAAALRGVFGLSEDRVGDRFLTSVAVLGLLGEAAEEMPLACLVDEVGWLDDESVQALAFVARRLEAEPIGFVVALTEEDAQRFSVPKAIRVRLSPLADEDALAVVRDTTASDVAPAVATVIMRMAAGVPLLLTELASSLSAEQLKGREPLPTVLRVPAGVEQLVLDRVRALPADARTALLVAAATRLGQVKVIAAALRVMGLDEDALDAAVRSGLIEVSDHVRFMRPAARLAVYEDASAADRRRVHDAIASVLVDPTDEDLRVWHLAQATLGPDEDVAEELERSADRAARRSGCAAAAWALERAAALSADDGGRARRLARAAEMAWLGGRSDRAMAFAAEAEAVTRDPAIEARIGFVRAAWEAQHGVTSDAIPLALRAADAVEDADPATAFRALVVAFMVMSLVGRRPTPAEIQRVERLAARTPDADAGVISVLRVNAWMAGGATTPPPALTEDPSSLVQRLDDPVFAPFAVPIAAYLGDLGAARINGELVVRGARARGALAMLSFALRMLAGLDVWTRRLDDARVHAAEGIGLALETGNENVVFVFHGILAAVAAVRGEEATCREEADAALLGAIERGNVDALGWANLALGHLDLSLGRLEASDRFDAVWSSPATCEPRLIGAADAVEADVRAERRDTAQLRLAELERWATQTSAACALPLVARCRALLASGPDVQRYFEEALAFHEGASSAFDRARTELLFGEFLRRDRRRAEARPHLRAAVEAFASVRAAIWEERARSELRATGEVVRHRGPDVIWQLTPQELQIARLVAKGASNRDAAAELFLSPRTVEYHLRKVFTKLGISSRGDLVRMSLDGGDAVGIST
jgi:DNA-binding CsgD family transcriptional regulator